MAARAIWKGVIEFGSVELPVKLYAAIQDRAVRFNLLNSGDKKPVRQHMVSSDSGEVVESETIRKGFIDDNGLAVMLDDGELEDLAPKPSRDIKVSKFAEMGSIEKALYDRPYYLGPDGDSADYYAFAQALADTQREGIAHWVMRKREYIGSLRPHDGFLMLVTLHHADEIIPASALPKPTGPKLDARELKLARQLVATLEDDFDAMKYEDEFRKRVEAFVKAKARGKQMRIEKVKPRAQLRSLASALEASLETVKKEKRSA
jgi:DNA end-binding protein Ku